MSYKFTFEITFSDVLEKVPDPNEECSICLERGGQWVKLDCGHSFHKKCTREFLRYSKRCPLCRKAIEEEECVIL